MLPPPKVLPRSFTEARSRYTIASKTCGQLGVASKRARTVRHLLPHIEKSNSRNSLEEPKSDKHMAMSMSKVLCNFSIILPYITTVSVQFLDHLWCAIPYS